MNVTRNKGTVSIGQYSKSFSMVYNPLNYDVILGEKWCAKHKARINIESHIVRIIHRSRKITVRALGNSDSEISVNFVKLKDKTAHIFAVTLKPSEKAIDRNMHKDIRDLIHEYRDVFPEKLPIGLPPFRVEYFSVEFTPDAKPQSQGIYSMSQHELEEVRKKITKLVEQGLIRPSSSPWGAPVLFSIKKDGTLRFCVDYRALNPPTNKNGYSTPSIDELVDSLNEARYFLKIYLVMGYHQIPLNE